MTFLLPTNDILNISSKTVDITKNVLATDEELEIKKNFPIVKRENLLQDIYLLYNQINFVEKSYITELNIFLSIYGSLTCFDKKNDHISIISPTNTVKFELNKDTFKDVLNRQITKINGQKAEIIDKKIHQMLISNIGKKKKKKVK